MKGFMGLIFTSIAPTRTQP